MGVSVSARNACGRATGAIQTGERRCPRGSKAPASRRHAGGLPRLAPGALAGRTRARLVVEAVAVVLHAPARQALPGAGVDLPEELLRYAGARRARLSAQCDDRASLWGSARRCGEGAGLVHGGLPAEVAPRRRTASSLSETKSRTRWSPGTPRASAEKWAGQMPGAICTWRAAWDRP